MSAWLRLALPAALACGCSSDLLHGLDEREANQAVAALAEAGLDSDKVPNQRPRSYRLVVPRAQQAAAVRTLEDRGLPHPSDKGVSEAFVDPGLLPDRAIDRARLAAALAVDAERALEAIPGVSLARVRLTLAAPPSLDGTRAHATAAVLLRTRGVPAVGEGEIRRLVARGIEGLAVADIEVSVLVEPAATSAARPAALLRLGPLWLRPDSVTLLLAALALAVIALLAALVALRRP